ncbi:MAG: TolC family protein [Deltaproteobacteria bacterium]|nr:TolC family protein [Deltaproteobacteria bacterium]
MYVIAKSPFHKPFSKKIPRRKGCYIKLCLLILILSSVLLTLAGCGTASKHRINADKAASDIISKKQKQVLGSEENFSIERPSDILRRRLLIEQELPYAGEASLGTDKLKSIKHWPEKDYPRTKPSPDSMLFPAVDKPLKLSLMQALQVGARNSSDYQTKKEDVFRSALSLDLERNRLGINVTGQAEGLIESDSSGNSTVKGTEYSGSLNLKKTFKTGIEFSAALAADLVNLLTAGGASSLGLVGDASISIPLLRGSGTHIVAEPLTQAERDVVYSIYEFERFKKTFAVNIAGEYLTVLKRFNQVENAAENYKNLIALARRQQRLSDSGRATQIDVDQAVQRELRARERWITSIESYKTQNDSFKKLIGLPPDARIELVRTELDQAISPTSEIFTDIVLEEEARAKLKTPPADAAIELIAPDKKDAGPLEMDSSLALGLGLKNRLDLRVKQGKVYDAQRVVVVLADALGAEITLLGSAELGQSRSYTMANLDNANLRTGKGVYSALLTLDLPFERTAERNAYRNGIISLERAVRDVQGLEDEIKLAICNKLRNMSESREKVKIQARSVYVANKRVKSADLFLEAGRAQLRDLLEAQEALLTAKNGLTAAVLDYRVAELEFQRDTGLLKINAKGLWQEYKPEEMENVKN